MTKCDILICGAGIPGMACAQILAQGGLSVILIDAAPAPHAYAPTKPDGRTIALMNPSIKTLKRANLWQNAALHATQLKNMCVCDDSLFPKGEILSQTFFSDELGEDTFGWNTPLSALRAAFIPHKNLTFMPSTRLTAINNAAATLDNGQTITAKLIIGADGKNSIVRELSGLKTTRRPYGQTAMTCVIGHTLPHNNTSTEFHRPGGPFTLVPMHDNQCAIVWVEHDADAQNFLSLPRDAFEAAISDRTRGKLGKITLLSNPASFPLEYMRTPKLTGPRVALMAEAAHAMSPIGAQGMNLSLRDAEDLANTVLSAHQNGLDIGSPTVLNAYEKTRKSDLDTFTTAIDIANRTVASDSKLLRLLRRTTLHALSLPTPLRKLAMKSGLKA